MERTPQIQPVVNNGDCAGARCPFDYPSTRAMGGEGHADVCGFRITRDLGEARTSDESTRHMASVDHYMSGDERRLGS
jgi:hypothetical protein